jgi:hypothetical protein
MSGSMPPGGGFFSILSIALSGLSERREVLKLQRAESEAREQAVREALAAERASVAQQRKWHEEVARQNARGLSRFATAAEARAALRGKGGRTNPLDKRKFR